ncbi:EAL domain-containing protein [Sphingomonas sp. MG17]|uniref:cyclic-guanylate-specific phosphodiesterase n=1 Tax=Sphingomonas tagetis TaxID=2949092 RepID=A0A9X2HDG3_9SPHN|nr:EAL domain-containing protein [Sphingomonas tagetis]MCP3729106.1 EAL domain-containing protein [Sphingomonas tagetis]
MKPIGRLTLAIVIGVCCMIAVPIGAAIALARQQAVEREELLVLSLARSALARSDETGDQIAAAARAINPLTDAEACSRLGLDLMRKLDLGSTLLQGVGRMEGNVMRCSSFAGGKAFDLGPPQFVSANGTIFRAQVRLIDPALPYVAVQAGATVAIVHKELALSFVEAMPGLDVSVISWLHRIPILSRGDVPLTLLHSKVEREAIFRVADRTVGVARSKRYDTGAIVVLPANQAATYATEAAKLLVPIGLLVGIALSALLIWAMRSWSSTRAIVRQGLRRREYHLCYQPVIDLASGRIVGAEALIRWRRSSGEIVPPDIFIPAAEEAGIICAITGRVFDLLAEDASDVLRIEPDFHFAVNLSAADMHRSDIIADIHSLTERSGIPHAKLIVEVTERSVVDLERARETVHSLRRGGIAVAIDDFGTGYSSLAYLAQLDVDFLKIDKLFVHSLGTGSATNQVAARIIEMANDLNLRIIAEGIETRAQEMILRNLGVHYAQGYLYDRPLSLEDLLQRLRAQRAIPRRKKNVAA